MVVSSSMTAPSGSGLGLRNRSLDCGGERGRPGRASPERRGQPAAEADELSMIFWNLLEKSGAVRLKV